LVDNFKQEMHNTHFSSREFPSTSILFALLLGVTVK